MSEFEYTDPDGDSLSIVLTLHGTGVVVVTSTTEVLIRNEDAPRVALELLKAAGYGDEANPLAATDAIADLNGIITELEVIASMKQPA